MQELDGGEEKPPKSEPEHAPAQETLFQVQKSGGVRLGTPPPRAELERAPANIRESNPCTVVFRKDLPASTQNHVDPEIEIGIRNFQVKQDTAALPGIKEIDACNPSVIGAVPQEGEGETREAPPARPGTKAINLCNPFVDAATEEGEGRAREGALPLPSRS